MLWHTAVPLMINIFENKLFLVETSSRIRSKKKAFQHFINLTEFSSFKIALLIKLNFKTFEQQ